MKETEHNIQVACATWMHAQYPNCLGYAIPNGGKRNAAVAAKLKAEGVVSGMPDIHIPVARKGFIGLWIEMKAGKNKQTKNQMAIMDMLRNEGHKYEVCYSFEEFQKVVNGYLK